LHPNDRAGETRGAMSASSPFPSCGLRDTSLAEADSVLDRRSCARIPAALAVLFLTTLAAGTRSLSAQVEPPAPAWRTQLELGINGSRGNSSFAVLRTGFAVTYLRTDAAEVELAGLFNYGKSEDELIARNWRSSAKVDLSPEGRWSPFLFATAAGDALRRLDLRSEGGAGVKHTFWRSDAGNASLSVASLYSYVDFEQEAGLPPLSPEHSARWSVRGRLERRLGSSLVKTTTYSQPLWDRGGDFLLDAVTTLTTEILGDLTLSVEHAYLHDASPPAGVLRDDQTLSVVFRYTF
jgi:hypothetical protein